jgi:gliding motility-associated-like protein
MLLPNEPSPHAFPAMTTIYSLVVWSNGCPSAADTVQVRVHTTPSVDAGWDRDICLGESIMLDAIAGGDSTAQFTYQWSTAIGLNNPNLEDPIATPPRSTTYFVVATSNWGCSSTADSVTITLRPTPVANAGSDTTVCFGKGLNLNGSYGYGETDSVANPSQIHFAWTPAALLSDSSDAQPYLVPQTSGMYYLNVSHQDCQTIDSVLVLVIPALNAGIAVDTTVICRGDSLQLVALGGLGNPAYQWSPTPVFEDPAAGQTWLYPNDSTEIELILSEAGCSDTAYLDISVIPSPVAAFLHSSEAGCVPLELNVQQTSSDAQGFIWEFGDGTAVSNLPTTTHIYDVPGTYSLQFTALHQGACSSQASNLTVTVFPAPSAEVQVVPDFPALLYLPEAVLSLEERNPDVISSTWDFGDGIQLEGQSVTHEYLAAGFYNIVVHSINAQGCLAHDTLGPYEVRTPDLFIPNVFSPNGDGVNDVFLVNYSGDQPFTLTIMDRWGSRVFHGTQKTLGWDGRMKGDPAPDGVYFYSLRIGNKDFAGELSLVR